MTVEIGLLFAAIACIIGIVGFFGGRQTAAKKDGQEWGSFQAELKKDIEYIKRDIELIKMSFNEDSKELKASIRRVHKRIDDHMRNDHKMVVPNYTDD